MEPIYPRCAFGSINILCWQNHVILRFSEHRRYRILLWEFGPTLFEYLCKQKGLNAKELWQKNEKREEIEEECFTLLEEFGEMKMYWWWPWSKKIKDIAMDDEQKDRAMNYANYSFLWRLMLSLYTNVIVHQWRITLCGYVNNYQNLIEKESKMKRGRNFIGGLRETVVAKVNSLIGAVAGTSIEATAKMNEQNELVPTNRFSNLIRAVILSNSFSDDTNMTLSKALEILELKWLLVSLDMSFKEMEEGKKSKKEHDEYVREKIKNVQRLSLKYHPDKQAVNTHNIQQIINETKKVLNNVHNYVINMSRNVPKGYVYKLCGELSLELINREKDLHKIINIAACNNLYNLVSWEEGRLMEERNYYLEEAKGHYVELLKNKLGLVKKILDSKEPEQEAKNCIDAINKIKSSFEKYNEGYKKLYEEVWVKNLKELSKECTQYKTLEIVKPEVEKLLKEAEEQYKILKNSKEKKIKANEIFVQPILEYEHLVNMYYKFTIKLCENIANCFVRGKFNYEFFEQQKFVLGGIETKFTKESKEYLKTLSYQELCQISQRMGNWYFHKQNMKELKFEVAKYYSVELFTTKEVGNVLVFALNQCADLLKKKFQPKETFYEKERRKSEECAKELAEINEKIREAQRIIEEKDQIIKQIIKQKAERRRAEQEAEGRREAEQRAEQETQRAAKLEEALRNMGVDPSSVLHDLDKENLEIRRNR